MKSLPNPIGSCNELMPAASRNQLVTVALATLPNRLRLSLDHHSRFAPKGIRQGLQ